MYADTSIFTDSTGWELAANNEPPPVNDPSPSIGEVVNEDISVVYYETGDALEKSSEEEGNRNFFSNVLAPQTAPEVIHPYVETTDFELENPYPSVMGTSYLQ